MRSAQPERARNRSADESPPWADGNGSARGVAARFTASPKGRSKPKAKEQEVSTSRRIISSQHGYQGASINAMARSSGISKESIYRYFSSKKQLFEAVIGRELAEYANGPAPFVREEDAGSARGADQHRGDGARSRNDGSHTRAAASDFRRGPPFTRRRSALLHDRPRVCVCRGRRDLQVSPCGKRLRSGDPEPPLPRVGLLFADPRA